MIVISSPRAMKKRTAAQQLRSERHMYSPYMSILGDCNDSMEVRGSSHFRSNINLPEVDGSKTALCIYGRGEVPAYMAYMMQFVLQLPDARSKLRNMIAQMRCPHALLHVAMAVRITFAGYDRSITILCVSLQSDFWYYFCWTRIWLVNERFGKMFWHLTQAAIGMNVMPSIDVQVCHSGAPWLKTMR